MTRWAVAGLIVSWLALAGLAFHHTPAPTTAPAPTPVQPNTHRADSLQAIVDILDSAEHARLDSLRLAFRSRPVREVIRWLPAGDTIHDTLPPAVVPDATIRATADSLASCRESRDSMSRAAPVRAALLEATRAALDSSNAKSCPPQAAPPSRALWASLGATAAALIAATVIIIAR